MHHIGKKPVKEPCSLIMAQQLLKSSRITGVNWDMRKNIISIKKHKRKVQGVPQSQTAVRSFKTIHLRKDSSEIKIEFLDENRRRCRLSLSSFKLLCDLKDAIEQITSADSG